MLQRLRSRAQGQEGFTLIELLVVILIIGILAAVAIPSFLSQKSKGADANVKSSINSAQTAEETYNTQSGSYVSAKGQTKGTANPLLAIEATLSPAFNTTASSDGTQSALQVDATKPAGGYTITAHDDKNIAFTLVHNADGTTQHTCSIPTKDANPGGCNVAAGATTGSW